MSVQESVRIVDRGDVALLEFDVCGEKVNKLSSAVMARLKEVLVELKNTSYKAVVIISRKPDIFIAGADIEEIKSLKTAEELRPAINEAHDIINMIEDHPLPFVAAIHGACLGGGCELVLACDYRIATEDKKTRLGLPEIQLGIIPGFGGCVRMPRVVGLQAALDIILAGKSVIGKKARKIGLVDEVVYPNILEKRALEVAQAWGTKPKRHKKYEPKGVVNSLLNSCVGKPIVFRQARKMVMKQTKGFYPAPLVALDVIEKTYGYRQRKKALQTEREGFCKVGPSLESKNLINLFFMMEEIKKQTGVSDSSVKAQPITDLAVLGAGVMGGGIAYVAADKGVNVRMKDINNDSLALGFKQASTIWQKKLKRRRINKYEYDRKMSRVSGGLDFSGFGSVDVVVEAIVEDMGIKKKVIGEAASHCSKDCIIATNTSSLSVSEMSAGHPRPENFIGMHFFNPVDKMPLVEVIRGEKTSDQATATIFELAKTMGKIPVVVKDGPGFLVNRLLLPFMGEALFLLEDGMSIEKVDRLFTHKFGMPMGPFRLLDEVGIDVGVKVLKIFKKSFGARMEVSDLADKLAKLGRLGKKAKKGFYLYDEKGKETEVDSTIYGELGLESPTNPLPDNECLHRGLYQMVNEAALAMIEDHIVRTPQELDLAMIMGTGFPPFRGGLLRWADTVGVEEIVQQLEIYATRIGVRFKVSTPLLNMAKTQRSFYPLSAQKGKSTGANSKADEENETAVGVSL